MYVYDVDISSVVTLTSSGSMPHYQVRFTSSDYTVALTIGGVDMLYSRH